MKSTIWPIKWTYSGDTDKAKEFHGEGRALIGLLKNNTYGSANLGQNKCTKTFNDGTEIKADILPGIDKVHIHVPPQEERRKKEEEDYRPYLWVGCRIQRGSGLCSYVESPPFWSSEDVIPHMYVWEPPQEDKQGQNWSPDNPNQTQCIASERNGTMPIFFNYGTACMYPLQTHNYWKPYYGWPATSFISYGQDIGQAFVKRIHREPIAQRLYYTGGGDYIFSDDITYQLTDDHFMMCDWMNPYDPEYSHSNPDPDKIWYTTAWCDPDTKNYFWEEGFAPIHTARHTFPSNGPASGTIQPWAGYDKSSAVDIGWCLTYLFDNYYGYANAENSVNGSPNINAKIIPGQYVMKVALVSAENCADYFSGPVKIEMEARVGKKGFGRAMSVKHTASVPYSPAHGFVAMNIVPYGWWYYEHQSYRDVFFGDYFGACAHTPNVWWQGAILIDAYNGAITVVDKYDFNDNKAEYQVKNTDSYGGGSPCYDYPFAGAFDASLPCNEMPCTTVPCQGLRRDDVFGYIPEGYPHGNDYVANAFAWYVVTGSYGPFTYGYGYARYLLGRYAYIRCSWTVADKFTIGVDGFLPDLFTHFITICDKEWPTYNGEDWPSHTYCQLEGCNFTPVQLGDKVIVVLPDTGHIRVMVPDDVFLGFLRQAPADFDRAVPPPSGYTSGTPPSSE